MRQLCLLLGILAAASSTSHAGLPPIAPIDAAFIASPAASQLWTVSTRRLPHAPRRSSRRLLPDVSRYGSSRTWRPASPDELLAPQRAPLTTVVLVHGNDTDDGWARSRGLGLYEALERGGGAPFRLIVWSWPAEYVAGGFRHDARVKAERADSDAFYLAQFISELSSDVPVQLLGYSLGARVVTGGLHLLAGGSLAGTTFEPASNQGRPLIRATLIAAAIDDDWLLPGRRHGLALSVADHLVVWVNHNDRVLRWYRFLSPQGAAALGVRGVAAAHSLGQHRPKIEQVNVNPYVGGQHSWSGYAASPQVVQELRRDILRIASRREKWVGGQLAADSAEPGHGIRVHSEGLMLHP
ncbi:MAG TPA: hypothetical protein VFI31_14245 [Pirellulales bacterium]|nr:hypothetical protein [Pirellulales bacterium]